MTKEITIKDELTEFLLYTSPNGEIKVEAFLHDENIWLTQKKMAELFGKGRSTITEHLQNIFSEGELREDLVSRDFRHTAQHGAIEGKTQKLTLILKSKSKNLNRKTTRRRSRKRRKNNHR